MRHYPWLSVAFRLLAILGCQSGNDMAPVGVSRLDDYLPQNAAVPSRV